MKRPPKRLRRRAVLVQWVDSAAPPGWMGVDERVKPVECWSLGWLVEKTKTALVVTSTVADCSGASEQYHAPLAIPRCAVRSWCYVKPRLK